jgi:hypothetical protein
MFLSLGCIRFEPKKANGNVRGAKGNVRGTADLLLEMNGSPLLLLKGFRYLEKNGKRWVMGPGLDTVGNIYDFMEVPSGMGHYVFHDVALKAIEVVAENPQHPLYDALPEDAA